MTRVLIVGDEGSHRGARGRLLHRRGFDVAEAVRPPVTVRAPGHKYEG